MTEIIPNLFFISGLILIWIGIVGLSLMLYAMIQDYKN